MAKRNFKSGRFEREDITGRRFGKLVAVKFVEMCKGKARWLCQCDCGKTSTPLIHSLLSGDTESCGCGHFNPERSCIHSDKEHRAKGLCTRCYYNQPEQIEKSRKYYRATKHAVGSEEWIRRRKRSLLKSKYNITLEKYEEMLNSQKEQCICGKTFKKMGSKTDRACIDHDHKCCGNTKICGKCIRGILCFRCNSVLGFLENEPHLLPEYLKNYLSRYSA